MTDKRKKVDTPERAEKRHESQKAFLKKGDNREQRIRALKAYHRRRR